ncbi:hypothetical protein B4144_3028 [Bacillus atrophaeus]|nr:hypothetical protein D068_cds21140 [Bacillus atrophaeus UCMB-5137]KYD02532.1 hypothetical protein B4144_3028 [Bacillus atrophaeus]
MLIAFNSFRSIYIHALSTALQKEKTKKLLSGQQFFKIFFLIL